MVTVLFVAGIFAIAVAAVWFWPRRTASSLSAPPPQADAPRPFGYKMSWLAVRTRDTARLVAQLELRNVRRATWEAGVSAIYAERAGDVSIFITPPIGPWTFVAGLTLPHPLGPAFVDKCSPLLTKLSKEFGEAQYFFTFPLLDFYAWVRAKDGAILRAFATGDEGIIWNRGRLTPEEQQLNFRLFELRGVDDRHGDMGGDLNLVPTEDQVLALARLWSIDPSHLGEDLVRSGETLGFGYLGHAPSAWRSELRRRKAA